jgi:hypothetical protein
MLNSGGSHHVVNGPGTRVLGNKRELIFRERFVPKRKEIELYLPRHFPKFFCIRNNDILSFQKVRKQRDLEFH